MKNHLPHRLLLLLMLALLAAFGATPNARANNDGPDVGDDAPDITFTDLATGQNRKLSELRGKTVVLDFWARWCNPCIAELQSMREIHAKLKDTGVVVLGMSIDENPADAKAYIAKNDMPWLQGHATGEMKSEPTTKFGVKELPAVFLIGADGKLKAKGLRGEDTEKAIELHRENKLAFAADPPVKVSGLVVDADGEPIANAKVRIVAKREADIDKGILYKEIWDKSFTTDKNGIWTYGEMFAGANEVSLGVKHPDYHSTGTSHEVSAKDFYAGKTQRTLWRGNKVTGVVKDETGKPLAGIPVLYGDLNGFWHGTPQMTNEKGEFTHIVSSNDSASHEETILSVQIKGYAPVAKQLHTKKDETVEFVLKPPKTLKGIVVDKNGNPIPKVWIVTESFGEKGEFRFQGRVVYSDERGHFEFGDMPEGKVHLGFMREGFTSQREVPAAAGEENRITLIPRTKIVGRVVDAATGQPVKEYTVERGESWGKGDEFYWDGNRVGHAGFSEIKMGTEGRFQTELNWISGKPKPYVYRAKADGYYPCLSEKIIPDGGTHEIILRLRKGKPLELNLVDDQGKPIVGASVLGLTDTEIQCRFENAQAMEKYAKFARDAVKSDETGYARGPVEWTDCALFAWHPAGYAIVPRENVKSVKTLELTPWERITGRVLRSDGKPDAGAKISYRTWPQEVPLTGVEKLLDEHGLTDFSAETVADANGFFEIKHAVAGFGALARESAGRRDSLWIRVLPGKPLTVDFIPAGRAVEGRIVLPAGIKSSAVWGGRIREGMTWKALAGTSNEVWEADDFVEKKATPEEILEARLEMLESQKKEKFFHINKDLTFRTEGIPSGKYNIYIGGNALRFVEVPVEITLPPGCVHMPEPLVLEPIVLEALPKAGDVAPEFGFVDKAGKEWRLSDFKGKTVLVYFWTGRYRYSREQMPEIQAIGEAESGRKDFVVLCVSLDRGNEREKLWRFIEERGWKGIQGHVSEESDFHKVAREVYCAAWGNRSICLIGADGRIVARDLHVESDGVKLTRVVAEHLRKL